MRPFVQKEALTGSSVELYCLPGFQDSQPEVMWSKDGTALDKLADSSSVKTLGKGVVLWIKNVSMETAGSYTCVVPSGNVSENFTSHVVVVGKRMITFSCSALSSVYYHCSLLRELHVSFPLQSHPLLPVSHSVTLKEVEATCMALMSLFQSTEAT